MLPNNLNSLPCCHQPKTVSEQCNHTLHLQFNMWLKPIQWKLDAFTEAAVSQFSEVIWMKEGRDTGLHVHIPMFNLNTNISYQTKHHLDVFVMQNVSKLIVFIFIKLD